MERSSSILQGRNRTHSIRSHETEDEEDLLQQGLDFDQQDQDKAQLRENIRFRTTSEQDKELEQRRDGDEEMNLNPFGLSPLESLTRNGSELENLNRKENQSLNFGKEELEKLIERKMGPRVGSRAGTGFSSRSGSGKTLSPIDFNSKPTSRMSNLDFNDGLNDLRSTWENTKGDQGNGMAYIRKIRQDEDLFSPTSQSQEYEKEDLNSTLSLWKNQSHLKSLLTGSTSNGGSFSKESESQPIAADFGQDFFDDDDDDEDTEFGDEVGDNRAESSSRGSRNMIPRSLTPTRLFAGAGTQAMTQTISFLSRSTTSTSDSRSLSNSSNSRINSFDKQTPTQSWLHSQSPDLMALSSTPVPTSLFKIRGSRSKDSTFLGLRELESDESEDLEDRIGFKNGKIEIAKRKRDSQDTITGALSFSFSSSRTEAESSRPQSPSEKPSRARLSSSQMRREQHPTYYKSGQQIYTRNSVGTSRTQFNNGLDEELGAETQLLRKGAFESQRRAAPQTQMLKAKPQLRNNLRNNKSDNRRSGRSSQNKESRNFPLQVTRSNRSIKTRFSSTAEKGPEPSSILQDQETISPLKQQEQNLNPINKLIATRTTDSTMVEETESVADILLSFSRSTPSTTVETRSQKAVRVKEHLSMSQDSESLIDLSSQRSVDRKEMEVLESSLPDVKEKVKPKPRPPSKPKITFVEPPEDTIPSFSTQKKGATWRRHRRGARARTSREAEIAEISLSAGSPLSSFVLSSVPFYPKAPVPLSLRGRRRAGSLPLDEPAAAAASWKRASSAIPTSNAQAKPSIVTSNILADKLPATLMEGHQILEDGREGHLDYGSDLTDLDEEEEEEAEFGSSSKRLKRSPSGSVSNKTFQTSRDSSWTSPIVEKDSFNFHKENDSSSDLSTISSEGTDVAEDVVPPPVPADDQLRNGTISDGTSKIESQRMFPQGMQLQSTLCPGFYQRYQVPSSLPPSLQIQIFGGQISSKFHPDILEQAKRGVQSFGDRNEPDCLFDLYTPRFIKSTGAAKEGLCPICLENGHKMWFKTKNSAYNYHLQNAHGIDSKTGEPFTPPVAFRKVVTKHISKHHNRDSMVQGKCHVCQKFVDIQSIKLGEIKVPEIFWWKHAQTCHKKREVHLEGLGGTFVKDALYNRVVSWTQANTNREHQ